MTAPLPISLTPHDHAVNCLRLRAKRRRQQVNTRPAAVPSREKAKRTPKAEKRPRGKRPAKLTDAILRYLSEHGPATGRQISESLGLDADNTRSRCKQLYAQKRLVHVVEGAGNMPATYGLVPGAPAPVVEMPVIDTRPAPSPDKPSRPNGNRYTSPSQERVLAWLREHRRGTQEEIAAQLELSAPAVYGALGRLVDGKQARVSGRGNRYHPAVYEATEATQ